MVRADTGHKALLIMGIRLMPVFTVGNEEELEDLLLAPWS